MFTDECVSFLTGIAKELELPVSVTDVAVNNPVVVITVPGEQPELPSVLLNSHMDVVPVFAVSVFFPNYDTYVIEMLYNVRIFLG